MRLRIGAQLQLRVGQVEPVGLAVDGLAAQQRHDDVERLVHHLALVAGIDADLQRVVDQRAGTHAEHRAAPRHVVELDHAVGDHERVVVGQRHDPGAEADVAGALRRGGDEHLRAGDQLEPAGMVLADPGLVVVEPVEMLEQFEVALDRQGRVLVVIVERRQEDAAAQIEIAHECRLRSIGRAIGRGIPVNVAVAPARGKRFSGPATGRKLSRADSGPAQPPVSSRRTIAAPSASARNLPKATARGRYFMPQSGAATRRSGAM